MEGNGGGVCYYHGISLQCRKPQTPHHNNRSLGRDLNPGPQVHEAKVGYYNWGLKKALRCMYTYRMTILGAAERRSCHGTCRHMTAFYAVKLCALGNP